MKPIFTPQQFHRYYENGRSACSPEQAAEEANETLARLVESWPVVYGTTTHSWSDVHTSSVTHKAYLAFIEEIEKEKCEHEPIMYTFTSGEDVFQRRCRKCGVELVAEWKEKK